jgi:hypothetical protein
MCRNYSPSMMIAPYISLALRIERLGIAKLIPEPEAAPVTDVTKETALEDRPRS